MVGDEQESVAVHLANHRVIGLTKASRTRGDFLEHFGKNCSVTRNIAGREPSYRCGAKVSRSVPIAVVSIYTNVRIQNLSVTSSTRGARRHVEAELLHGLRLIVSRILVARSTGRSLGLAPRRILSMYSTPRVWVQLSSWP